MKEFYDEWTQSEIDEYLRTCPVLILFRIHSVSRTAELLVYGRLTESQKFALKTAITTMFGSNPLSKNICSKINDFSERWFRRNITSLKTRVINIKKKEAK